MPSPWTRAWMMTMTAVLLWRAYAVLATMAGLMMVALAEAP